MLTRLTVSNYILIRQLEINFCSGLTVITGETGAGKSILLGALSLILGQRADSSSLFDKNIKCIIEGSFETSGLNLEPFFTLNNLDFDDVCILRREITPSGKSRSFINDTPVSLVVLKELGDQLINIHSQRQTAEVRSSAFQIEIFDSYAGHSGKILTFRKKYLNWVEMKSRLEELKNFQAQSLRDRDYLQFQLDELNEAGLIKGESEELENEFKILSHSDEIKNGMLHCLQCLDGSESNALNLLISAGSALKPLIRFNQEIKELHERLNALYIDVKDVVLSVKHFEDQINTDPERLGYIADRLNLLNKLYYKHQVNSSDDLLLFKDEVLRKLEKMSISDDELTSLQSRIQELEIQLWDEAKEISHIRKHAIEGFNSEVTQTIKHLGIPEGQFQVEILPADKLSQTGTDNITFLFSANSGTEIKELSKVVSGGELSRITLAVKSLISAKNLIPSIIFDEIDTGVSGEIAGKVGNILLKMSENMQVIAITHIPQIASKGQHHFLVSKISTTDGPSTVINELEPNDRVENIARMISDKSVTDAAIATARELLGLNTQQNPNS